MSDLHELALAQLPKHQRVDSTEDIITLARAEDNKFRAKQAIEQYKTKKRTESNLVIIAEKALTQKDIDERGKNFTPEREITFRLQRLGV